MNSEQLPKNDNDTYNPNLDAQDEELESGKGNRLMYVLCGIILALVIAYIALPKGAGDGTASITPSFMLDDAAVTATAATSADSIAAGLKAAPLAATEEAEADEKPAAPAAAATAAPAKAASTAAPAAAPVVAATSEPDAAPVVAPEPAAPTTVAITGKIDDENGRPLAGATVMLKGSTKVVGTDANGVYTIEAPAGVDNTLIYGYGGYEDEVQHSSGSKPINVTLTPRAKVGKKRR